MSEPHTEPLDILRRNDATMAEILGALALLDTTEYRGRAMRLGIVANITVDLFADYLRRHAYLAGVRLEVVQGSYDDILNDVKHFVQLNVDHVLIIPFFDNLQAAWESRLENLSGEDRQAVVVAWLSKLALALREAASVGRVTIAGGHLWNRPAFGAAPELLDDFNRSLREQVDAYANTHYVDTIEIVARLGEKVAFNPRFYYRGKAPYTSAYLDEFARQFALSTRGFDSYFYKVLALDCDNTLWGGIVGEDGLAGIGLDPYDYPGNVYWVVQQQLRHLEAQGVLLCLCSKNNEADVAAVFAKHPSMVLTDEHIAAKQLDWRPKTENLRELARTLNLGLESFIFIDDSDFELNSVRTQLPQVRTVRVPDKLADYPAVISEITALFLAAGVSTESQEKTRQYKQLAAAAAEAGSFANHDDYLRSLDLKVRIYRDAREHISRIAELTQKSNQFNLTTRRYTSGEITALMDRQDAVVYSFDVSDRFGKCGVTGVIVVDFTSADATVDAFLMSCRVIGRGVEFAVWRTVVADAREMGMRGLSATYVPSGRNFQVSDFFDRLGLSLEGTIDGAGCRYRGELEDVRLEDSDWVELIDG